MPFTLSKEIAMGRKWVWLIGATVLGLLLFVLSNVSAQREFRSEQRIAEGGNGKYQVVQVTENEIIVMDTSTGDLYAAGPKDIKPYSSRPHLTPRKALFGTGGDKKDGPNYPKFKDEDVKKDGPFYPSFKDEVKKKDGKPAPRYYDKDDIKKDDGKYDKLKDDLKKDDGKVAPKYYDKEKK
jgi:hypothetical protein